MQILVNTDRTIEGSAELTHHVETLLTSELNRFNGQITRIEVHLGDENGAKFGENDKKCLLEARMGHHQPIVVSHHAPTIHQAIDGASDKLLRALDTLVGKLNASNRPTDLWEDEAPSV